MPKNQAAIEHREILVLTIATPKSVWGSYSRTKKTVNLVFQHLAIVAIPLVRRCSRAGKIDGEHYVSVTVCRGEAIRTYTTEKAWRGLEPQLATKPNPFIE